MNEVNIEGLVNAEEACPVCNSREFNEQYCNKCKHDFSELFPCPLTNDKILQESNGKVCGVDNNPCTVKGLMFETCDKYHTHGR